LDGGGHNPIQAYKVSIAARVSAAKSETERREEVSKRDAGQYFGVDVA
jgi:hypothetical protein